MFIITHGDGTDGTTDGDGTTGVGPETMDMEDGMTLSGDQAMAGTTGDGMLDGAGPDTTDMVADGTIHIIITMAITGIITALIVEEGIIEMLLLVPRTGHTPGIITTIGEIQILPIIEGAQILPIIEIQLIIGEAQIPHTAEEATTIVIIPAGETAETQILPMAIAEG